MTTKIAPPRKYEDLMAVTGLSRASVKAAIRSGELPGYKVGERYVVPAEAFDAFCAGTWVPSPRPLFPAGITPIKQPAPMLATRSDKSA